MIATRVQLEYFDGSLMFLLEILNSALTEDIALKSSIVMWTFPLSLNDSSGSGHKVCTDGSLLLLS